MDDGSSDATASIVTRYADMHPWIKLVKNLPSEVRRQGGGKVVRAFHCGYEAADITDFDFVVKLDADLTLPMSYFEEVAKCFASEPTVGMCGGFLTAQFNGVWKRERSARYHLRGNFKAYRKQCFAEIGGIRPVDNWDLLDEMTAMYLGWSVKILPLEVRHHRPTSTLINRGLRFSFAKGQTYYKDGYDLFLLALRSAPYGLGTKPYVLSSLGLILGYLYSCWTRPEKYVDAGLERFIRKFQYNRIKSFLRVGALN